MAKFSNFFGKKGHFLKKGVFLPFFAPRVSARIFSAFGRHNEIPYRRSGDIRKKTPLFGLFCPIFGVFWPFLGVFGGVPPQNPFEAETYGGDPPKKGPFLGLFLKNS